MRRHTLSAIVSFALLAAGILTIFRGQLVVGIAFIGIAILRLGTILWGRKPANPKPSIRLNLDTGADDDQLSSGQHDSPSGGPRE
jgi:hypothetical protein